MRYFRALIALNTVLALGLSMFIFKMLPFAHGVVQDANKIKGLQVRSLGASELYLSSLLPILIIGCLILVSFALRSRYPRLSLTVLVGPPTVVLLWVAIVFRFGAA